MKSPLSPTFQWVLQGLSKKDVTHQMPPAKGSPVGTWEEREVRNAGVEGDLRNLT